VSAFHAEKTEHTVGSKTYRAGDRVLWTRRNLDVEEAVIQGFYQRTARSQWTVNLGWHACHPSQLGPVLGPAVLDEEVA
jgi:hypothetical protein